MGNNSRKIHKVEEFIRQSGRTTVKGWMVLFGGYPDRIFTNF
jgi:hypothetical protein